MQSQNVHKSRRDEEKGKEGNLLHCHAWGHSLTAVVNRGRKEAHAYQWSRCPKRYKEEFLQNKENVPLNGMLSHSYSVKLVVIRQKPKGYSIVTFSPYFNF